jgi:hypothetical protein
MPGTIRLQLSTESYLWMPFPAESVTVNGGTVCCPLFVVVVLWGGSMILSADEYYYYRAEQEKFRDVILMEIVFL